ncbi:MAG TPA: LCP family protein [Pseudonocardiaceae bacterium]|jgi:LCP family protein required for cell wall assembly|nr:LCP family protein [Pseudonocardiaceae bacterium]
MNRRRELPVRNPYPRNPQARSEQDGYPPARGGQERPGQNRPPRDPGGPRRDSAARPLPDAPRGASSRARWLRAGKVLVAFASVLVLGITWYSWNTANGITTANVIDPSAQNPTGDQNILLVGLDNRTDAQGNPLPQSLLDELHAGSSDDGGDNTDTIIVIHIPAGGGKATAFSIPRDSYVQLAGGYGTHKINSAYTYAEVAAESSLKAQGVSGPQLAVQADAAGAQNAIHTIENFTGLTINHFASVNLAGFYSISNAIGGVQVCLKAPVHDSYSGADFPAGVQTIQGAQALAFVRQRHGLPLGDLDRIRRQQAFMASMAKQVLSAGVLTDPSKLNSLIDAIKQSITIDQGWDIFSFAQQMESMSAGNLQFETIPIVTETYPTPSDGDAVEVNPQQVQQFISSTIQAQNSTPSSSAPPPASSSANKANNADVTAEVLNGSGKSGLASKVLSVLTGQGFKAGGTGNTSARTSSVVEYGSGGSAGAQQVAGALGGLTTESLSSLPSGSVRVLLGTGYTGPTGATGTGSSTSSQQTSSSTPSGATPAITADGVTCVD